MRNPFFSQHLISTQLFSKETLNFLMPYCLQFKNGYRAPLALDQKILASCFFESSTRTRLSFESACLKLGGRVIGFNDSAQLSVQKGESFSDTLRMMGEYADILVLRHPAAGAAQLAADISGKLVINAGDGAHEHPTQALIDLFSIQESQGKIDGLQIAIAGDILHARTIYSLISVLSHFDVRLYFIAPSAFELPEPISRLLRNANVRYSLHQQISEIMPKLDILYLTRLQKERMALPALFQNNHILSLFDFQAAKTNFKILHPLPRQEELPTWIDATPHAYYFQQASHAIPVRQALLALMMQEKLT